MKLYDKCANCEEYKKKKCKGYQFSIDIIHMYCKKHKEKK